MARKVYLDVKVSLILYMEDGIEVSDAMENVHLLMSSSDDDIEVVDSNIESYDVTDSK
jgi:hypothetical protein